MSDSKKNIHVKRVTLALRAREKIGRQEKEVSGKKNCESKEKAKRTEGQRGRDD
jgi:hypothetical protein